MGNIRLDSVIDFGTESCTTVSAAGRGRICFDGMRFKVSENGGPYLDLLSVGVISSGWVDDGTVVRLATATDNVGIGTNSPVAKLHVLASFPLQTAIVGSSGTGIGVQGASTASTGVAGASTDGVGVAGTSTNGVGVFGKSTKDDGVLGNSTDGDGVDGVSTNGNGVSGSSTKGNGVFGGTRTRMEWLGLARTVMECLEAARTRMECLGLAVVARVKWV